MPDGPHTFQVRAVGTGEREDASASLAFFVDTVPPTAPNSGDPVREVSTGEERERAFTWTAAIDPGFPDTGSGVDFYVIEITGAENLTLTADASTICAGGTCNSTTPTLRTGSYSIRTSAVDAAGNQGPSTPGREFRAGPQGAVQGLAGVDPSIVVNQVPSFIVPNPKFRWSPPILLPNSGDAEGGIDTYLVSITGDAFGSPFTIVPAASFTDPTYFDAECFQGASDTVPDATGDACKTFIGSGDVIRIRVKVNVPDGNHRIGVRVLSKAGVLGPEETLDFIVDTLAPVAPELVFPAADAFQATGTVLFDWNPSSGDVFDYVLQVTLLGDDINSQSFRVAEFVVLHPATEFTGDLGDGAYQWRVVARDRALNTTSSETRRFTVDTIAPGPPALQFPGSGDFINDSTPLFDWDPGVPIGQTNRASVSSTEGQATTNSDRASISSDGRYVAFHSLAGNLVAGDNNAKFDIFVRDKSVGQTERVSVTSTGVQADDRSFNPSISFDGRYVAFDSFAGNLVTGDTNGRADVFIHDRQTGVTSRISVTSTGGQGNGDSRFPSISADGRFVVFHSIAANLVTGDTNARFDIFRYDRLTDDTVRVSVSSAGVQSNGASFDSSISSDGCLVAFESAGTNLVAGDTNARFDIFVVDVCGQTTERVSISTAGLQGNNGSFNAAISANGAFVVFDSDAANLVVGDSNSVKDIFIRERGAGLTSRMSVHTSGVQANGASSNPRVSDDGGFVTFESSASNLVAGDTNGVNDVFVRQRPSETTRVSVASQGQQADGKSFTPSISGNGGLVAFASDAANLVSSDSNGRTDILVHERGATGDITEYRLEVGSGDFSTTVLDVLVTGDPAASQFQTLADLADGPYLWRVTARDGALNQTV